MPYPASKHPVTGELAAIRPCLGCGKMRKSYRNRRCCRLCKRRMNRRDRDASRAEVSVPKDLARLCEADE